MPRTNKRLIVRCEHYTAFILRRAAPGGGPGGRWRCLDSLLLNYYVIIINYFLLLFIGNFFISFFSFIIIYVVNYVICLAGYLTQKQSLW